MRLSGSLQSSERLRADFAKLESHSGDAAENHLATPAQRSTAFPSKKASCRAKAGLLSRRTIMFCNAPMLMVSAASVSDATTNRCSGIVPKSVQRPRTCRPLRRHTPKRASSGDGPIPTRDRHVRRGQCRDSAGRRKTRPPGAWWRRCRWRRFARTSVLWRASYLSPFQVSPNQKSPDARSRIAARGRNIL